ncbi:MAG: hypothetical protein MRZ37_04000 [Tenericutes bacterium]|nr:hypothetical protein [Mycoplasmatota bacterium]
MSLNNRGFMMAELMITSVVIMISIVSLYTGFNKIYTNYKVRNSYDDSNLLYGTKLIKDFLIDQNKINLLIKNNKDYINISLCNLNFECVDDESTYYNDIKRIYNINTIYFLTYKMNDVKINDNNFLSDYIDYLRKDSNIDKSDYRNGYRIIVETKDNKYATLGIISNY